MMHYRHTNPIKHVRLDVGWLDRAALCSLQELSGSCPAAVAAGSKCQFNRQGEDTNVDPPSFIINESASNVFRTCLSPREMRPPVFSGASLGSSE